MSNDLKKTIPLGERITIVLLWASIPCYVVALTALIASNATWTHAAAYFRQGDRSQYTMDWDTCKIDWVGKSYSIAAINDAAEFHRACREAH